MTARKLNVLIIDDDTDFISDFEILLPDNMESTSANSVIAAEKILAVASPDLIFLDIDLGIGDDGLRLLEQLKIEHPYLPVIMITADQRIETVVRAMRLGASDYVGKSPDLSELKISIERTLNENELKRQLDFLRSEISNLHGNLIGDSEPMKQVKAEIKRLASVSSNVLITGESGTGKELVAREIHNISANRKHPFVAVNCAALSKELFESELFGHERGAFTGAIGQRIGKFEITGEGTLFLDEITEIPTELQAKLLRVLQESEFERVGGNKLIPFNGRLLASSNRDMTKSLTDGFLREDLYYRLSVTQIHLPRLEERREDIPLLVNYFIKLKSGEMKRGIRGITDEAMQLLKANDWRGNIRELANKIENAIVHCDTDIIAPSHLGQLFTVGKTSFSNYEDAKKHFLAKFQREYLSVALSKNGGNVAKTARDIGVSRQGLIKMMESSGLDIKRSHLL